MKTVAVHEERSFSLGERTMVQLNLGSTLQVPEGAGKPDKQAGSENIESRLPFLSRMIGNFLRSCVKRVEGLQKTSTGKHGIVVCPCKGR